MLHETCMLVNLQISLPPQTRTAKEASEKVEQEYKTARKQGRVTKNLFSKDDIKPLEQIANLARITFNARSLPYDSAYRILPTEQYFKFMEVMSKVKNEFEMRKSEFLGRYDRIKTKAQLVLGDLYDSDDYPPAGYLADKISIAIESSVVPSLTAFDQLAGLSAEAIENLKQRALDQQKMKTENALQDLFKRLFQSVHKAAIKLESEDSIFKNTLVGNIKDALHAVKTMNLTGDPKLNELAEKVQLIIDGVDPDDLRKDKKLRQETAQKTRELVKNMEDFF